MTLMASKALTPIKDFRHTNCRAALQAALTALNTHLVPGSRAFWAAQSQPPASSGWQGAVAGSRGYPPAPILGEAWSSVDQQAIYVPLRGRLWTQIWFIASTISDAEGNSKQIEAESAWEGA
jgi:hypothetical protein